MEARESPICLAAASWHAAEAAISLSLRTTWHSDGESTNRVKPIDEEETTASGIVLPDTAKEKPQKGKVVAVGDGRWDEDGEKRVPLDVAEGDEVLYSKYGGTEVTVEDEELLVLRESDVLAKVG